MLLDLIDRARGIGVKKVTREEYFREAISISDETRGRTTSYSPQDARDIASYASITAICAGRVASMCASKPIRLIKPKKKNGSASNVSRARKRWMRDASINGPGRKVAQWADQYEDFEEIYEHPILDLLSDPSSFSTGISSAEIRFLNRMLTGNSYTLKVRTARSGPPTELYDLCPAWVTILPSKTDFIAGYRYGRDQTASRVHEPEDIIHGIEQQDPQVPYRGRGVMTAILAEHQIYMAINQKQLVFFDNQARPDFIVSTDVPMSPEQMKQLRDQIRATSQGVNKTGSFFIFPKTASVTPIQFAPKDLVEIEQQRYIASTIAGAFGVAESEIFLNSANLASAEIGARQTARVAVLPRLQKDAAILNERLVTDFDDLVRMDARLVYDNPVPEDETLRGNRLSVAVNKWMTVNEARAEDGLEPLEGEQFDTIQSFQMPAPGTTPPTSSVVEEEDGSDNNEERDKEEAEKDDDTEPEETQPEPEKTVVRLPNGVRKLHSAIAAKQHDAWVKNTPTLHPDGDENEPVDVRWYRTLRRSFYEQQDAILSRMDAASYGLTGRMYRKDAYSPEVVAQMLAAWGISDPRQWDAMFVRPTLGYVTEAVTIGAQVGVDEAKKEGWKPSNPDSFYTSSERVVTAARERALTYAQSIQGVNDTTAKRLADAIAGGLERGDGLFKMKEAVKEAFSGLNDAGIPISDSRAATIARTESVRSQSDGRRAGWKATEAVRGKTFLLAPGSCQFCEAVAAGAAGKVIGIDEYFVPIGTTIVGADGGVMVNDYESTDNPHPNCRCGTQPVLITE